MTISALIADDEASARSRLRKLLSAYPLELIEGDAKDGVDALEAIRQHRPHVVFLDIEMPGLDGFGVVESLAPEQAPLIVFVTAYDEHALAALAMITAVIPGSVWSELAADRSALMIHVFDLDDEAAYIAHFKADYERPLKEIFE